MPTVFSNNLSIGTLSRGPEHHTFSYIAECPLALAVSLLMPVQSTGSSYLAEQRSRLHPVFDQSLPEGELREVISRMFAKALPVFDDFALLEIVGRSQIGRLRFAPSLEILGAVPTQNLRDLLNQRGTEKIFNDLLARYAQYSGVAGVQPKLLLRDDGSLVQSPTSPFNPSERITAAGTTHIVKTFDPVRYPGLGMNEYMCLKAAAASGLRVAPTELSTDGRVLVVERFDINPDGTYQAFEDCCALAGRVSKEKYEGSYEQVGKTLESVIRSPRGIEAELSDFFRSLCVSVMLRNGDAHRKNFGVLYNDATGDVVLAPTYDVLTSTVYIPRDTMALTMDGTKRWPDPNRLMRFGVTRCRLRPNDAQKTIEEVRAAISDTARQVVELNDGLWAPKDIVEGIHAQWQDAISVPVKTSVITTPRSPKNEGDLSAEIDALEGKLAELKKAKDDPPPAPPDVN